MLSFITGSISIASADEVDQFDEKCQLIFQAFDFDLTDEITPDEMVPTKLTSR